MSSYLSASWLSNVVMMMMTIAISFRPSPCLSFVNRLTVNVFVFYSVSLLRNYKNEKYPFCESHLSFQCFYNFLFFYTMNPFILNKKSSFCKTAWETWCCPSSQTATLIFVVDGSLNFFFNLFEKPQHLHIRLFVFLLCWEFICKTCYSYKQQE